MGVEIKVENLTKSFGKDLIWGDVTLTIPAGEICVMLGPSGTGKSVFLKTLIGLLKPTRAASDRGARHRELLGEGPLRGPQAVRRAVPGRRDVRLDGPLRQRRLPAARAHQEVRVRDPQHRHGEDGPRRSRRCRAQAPRRDLRRYAQARRPGPGAGPRPRDRALRRAGLRPRPGPYGVPQPAHRRPERADRRDVPDRHPRHQHRPDGAGQHRAALPQAPGDVRPPRDAAVLRGAGRPAVPQRPAGRPDRHVGGEGRRRARGREGPGAAAAAPDPAADRAHQRQAPAQPARPGRLVPGRTASTPPPGSFEDTTACSPREPDHGHVLDHLRARPAARRHGREAVRLRPRRRPGAVQATLPAAGVPAAGLVHRLGHDHPDRAGRDPVRRGHRAAGRRPDQAVRRPVLHRLGRRCWRWSGRPGRSRPRC